MNTTSDLMEIADASVVHYSESENKERGNWLGRFDFLLSCIGCAVGLGNLWRFPYLAYKNGGGAFLIPYLIMLVVAGWPLFFFELSFGQFSNSGLLALWRVSPMFKGIGYTMIVCSGLCCIYYNVIIAWTLNYFFLSLTSKLPWSECGEWSDNRCAVDVRKINVTNTSVPCTKGLTVNCTKYQVPAEQYWLRETLGIENYNGQMLEFGLDLGNIQWKLALCLMLAWVVVCACLIKGVKTSGKVVYFTAVFPYVVIIIMLVNGALLEGSLSGIKYYVIPRWERLLDHKVWIDAAGQMFYSLGIGFGGLITLSSYNRFKNNCLRDAMVVAIVDCCTSTISGFAIFSVIGYMSVKTGISIEDVTSSGSGLAFVVYAEGISRMKAAPFWSILFFLMLFTLGIDSQFAMLETIFSGLEDEIQLFRRHKVIKYAYKIILCIIFFALGLPLVTKGGIYYFTLLDDFSAGYTVLIISCLELVVVCYIYGIKNYMKDVCMMLGKRPNYYWIGCWMVVTPLVISVILVASFVNFQVSEFNNKLFPQSSLVLVWLILLAGISFVPGYLIYYIVRFGVKFAPDDDWGPPSEKYWLEDERYMEKLKRKSKQGQINAGFISTENVSRC